MSDEVAEKSGSVSADDIVISRDSEGALIPEDVYVEELDGEVRAIPMDNAAHEKYVGALAAQESYMRGIAEGDIDPDELSDEDLEEIEENVGLTPALRAEMLDKHIVEPDLLATYRAEKRKELAAEEGVDVDELGEDAVDIDSLDAEFVNHFLLPRASLGLTIAVFLASGEDDLAAALRGEVPDTDDEGN